MTIPIYQPISTIKLSLRNLHQIFKNPPVLLGFGVLALLAIYMIQIPLRNAGSPDEPAPPTAMM